MNTGYACKAGAPSIAGNESRIGRNFIYDFCIPNDRFILHRKVPLLASIFFDVNRAFISSSTAT